jgi:type II secretory pathway pseudopilin PulG
MTLSEVLIAATLFGVLLAVLMLGMDGIRTELKRRQTLDLLETLDHALRAYHQATGAWPADVVAPPETPSFRLDNVHRTDPDADSGDRVVTALASVAASRTILQTVPKTLRVTHGADRPTATAPGADSGGVRDSWGRPLCCLTAASPSAVHRKAVAANENRPIFISAGPDGEFGFVDVSTASDNLRSDEPRK